MNQQHTIAREIRITGGSPYRAEETTITLYPAPEDYGIRFVRTDLPEKVEIPAMIDNIDHTDVYRRTTIGLDETYKVHTVEHLLGTFLGLGIDNLRIEIDAGVPPFGDGSARFLVDAITDAGLKQQDTPRRIRRITSPIHFHKDEVDLLAMPSEKFRITFFLDYENAVIGTQSATFDLTPVTFIEQIAPARTFCLLSEIDELKKMGLVQNEDLKYALVIGEDSILNEGDLRFEDEFVRHKILDLLGDLYLLGCPIKGHVLAARSGHNTHAAFVNKIKEETEPIHGE